MTGDGLRLRMGGALLSRFMWLDVWFGTARGIGAEFLMSGFSYLEFLILVRVALGALATFLRGR